MIKKIALIITTYFVFSFSVTAVDIDISVEEWKKLDMPNRFPQMLAISSKQQPIYFKTGSNIDYLSDFLISLDKDKLDIDIDEDDSLKIIELKNKIFSLISKGDLLLNKTSLMTISANKMFDCPPCVEQQEYIENLKSDDFNKIYVHIVE